MRDTRYSKGTSFIELVIVLGIVGVLSAVAYPLYTQYKIRTNRSEVKSELINIAQRIKSYSMIHPHLEDITFEDLGLNADYPSQGIAIYDLSLSSSGHAWVLSATPKEEQIQHADGVIQLNEKGQKCWDKGAATCTLSVTSNWD